MTGPAGEAEIEKVETFDEAGQGTQVSFSYGPYGRVINKYEYGYKQGSDYQVRRRTEYDQSYRFRGNPTAVTTFSKIANPAESTTRQVRYDIFGNVVDAQMSCCVVKSFGFSHLTYYSQPDWVRSGPDSETELNLKTDYQYNKFTGQVMEERNPDGLPTRYEYDRALRLIKVISPTGAEMETMFQDNNDNDLLVYSSQTRYDDQGTAKVITSKQWLDGSGRVVRAGTGTGEAPNNDAQTRQQVATLKGHANFVYSVAFSPDGKTLASGSGDETVKLWVGDGRQRGERNGRSRR